MQSKTVQAANICYLEIPAPDLKKAGAFYSSVFRWDIQASKLAEESPYWMFSTGKGGMIGGLVSGRKAQEGGIIFYIQVEDIPSTLQAIRKAGGVVVLEKENVGGDYGFIGIFKDPNGNQVGLWSKN